MFMYRFTHSPDMAYVHVHTQGGYYRCVHFLSVIVLVSKSGLYSGVHSFKWTKQKDEKHDV